MRKYQTGITPVLVIQYREMLTDSEFKSIIEGMAGRREKTGWHWLVVDGMDASEVRAFGVQESEMEEFENLKKMIEERLKMDK